MQCLQSPILIPYYTLYALLTAIAYMHFHSVATFISYCSVYKFSLIHVRVHTSDSYNLNYFLYAAFCILCFIRCNAFGHACNLKYFVHWLYELLTWCMCIQHTCKKLPFQCTCSDIRELEYKLQWHRYVHYNEWLKHAYFYDLLITSTL